MSIMDPNITPKIKTLVLTKRVCGGAKRRRAMRFFTNWANNLRHYGRQITIEQDGKPVDATPEILMSLPGAQHIAHAAARQLRLDAHAVACEQAQNRYWAVQRARNARKNNPYPFPA